MKSKKSEVRGKKFEGVPITCYLLLATCYLSPGFAQSQIALRWETDVARPAPARFERYHGDAFRFEPTWLAYGAPLATNEMTFTLYWQTNGMGRAWFTNHLGGAFEWLPEYDIGADAYTFFIGVDGRNWQANGMLRMLPSPGMTPNRITPPVPYIDFAVTPFVNAPWLLTEADPVALPVANAALAVANAALAVANAKASPADVTNAVAAAEGRVQTKLDGRLEKVSAFGNVSATWVEDSLIIEPTRDWYWHTRIVPGRINLGGAGLTHEGFVNDLEYGELYPWPLGTPSRIATLADIGEAVGGIAEADPVALPVALAAQTTANAALDALAALTPPPITAITVPNGGTLTFPDSGAGRMFVVDTPAAFTLTPSNVLVGYASIPANAITHCAVYTWQGTNYVQTGYSRPR